MSEPALPPTTDRPEPPETNHAGGFDLDVGSEADVDKTLARIEMVGEEAALGFRPSPHEPLSPEVRFLHVSRTIHQLVTDRNRCVGIFLFVASLLFGGSTALLNVPERVLTIVPLGPIQYWCFPITFGVLAVIGAFMSLILIRARIGLIYEVAKMNALLGLPSTRVKRVNPLSIFFLMHTLVVVLGATSAGLMAGMLAYRGGVAPIAVGGICGMLYAIALQTTYYLTILRATSDLKLEQARV